MIATPRSPNPLSRNLLLAVAALLFLSHSADAADGRPWLCRDKPAFAVDKPVSFSAVSKGSRPWRLFFMQFSLNAAHDGFDITSSVDVPPGGRYGGSLSSGRFYAVALYRSQDHWICPRSSEEEEHHEPGVLSKICYSDEEDGPCRIELIVKQPAP